MKWFKRKTEPVVLPEPKEVEVTFDGVHTIKLTIPKSWTIVDVAHYIFINNKVVVTSENVALNVNNIQFLTMKEL